MRVENPDDFGISQTLSPGDLVRLRQPAEEVKSDKSGRNAGEGPVTLTIRSRSRVQAFSDRLRITG